MAKKLPNWKKKKKLPQNIPGVLELPSPWLLGCGLLLPGRLLIDGGSPSSVQSEKKSFRWAFWSWAPCRGIQTSNHPRYPWCFPRFQVGSQQVGEKDTCSFCSWASLLAHRLNRCLRILNLAGIFPHLGWEIPKFHMFLWTPLFTWFFCVSKCNDMGAANIQMEFSPPVEFRWCVVKVSVPCYNPHHAPSVNGFVCNLASDGTNKISTTAPFWGKDGESCFINSTEKKARQFQDIFSHPVL